MKVNELVEFVNNTKNKMLKGDQLQEVLIKQLEVKKYISIKDKKQLIDDIIDECILFENGVFKFDDIDKYIAFTMRTIDAYTNIELSSDIEEDYDELCQNNLLNVVINTFSGEYDNINLLLQMRCDYILSGNNIEAQFGKFLYDILDKINTFTDVLSDKIEEFDLSKLQVNKGDIKKFVDLINTQK